IPSIVVISAPTTAPTGTTHDRIASPFRCTVQAPQSAAPQPNLVPVSPRTSRRYQRTGISGSPSNERSTPFTLNWIIESPPPSTAKIDLLVQSESPLSERLPCPQCGRKFHYKLPSSRVGVDLRWFRRGKSGKKWNHSF